MNRRKWKLSGRLSFSSASSSFRFFVITNSISVLSQANPISSSLVVQAVVQAYWLEFKIEFWVISYTQGALSFAPLLSFDYSLLISNPLSMTNMQYGTALFILLTVQFVFRYKQYCIILFIPSVQFIFRCMQYNTVRIFLLTVL